MEAAEFISAHLSDEQKTEIAIEEWRNMCRSAFSNDPERVISNIGYYVARSIVDESLGDSATDLIAKKAVQVIEDLSEYSVFRSPSVYERNPSPAWSAMQKAVTDNADLLNQRISHHIHNLSKFDALDVIKSAKITLEVGSGGRK